MSFFANDTNFAAMQFEDSLGDRKAEPHGAIATSVFRISLVKAIKDVWQCVFGYSGAGVRDGYIDSRR
jgi:hypothetical protein